jgi:hypothetical protein
VPDAEDIGTTIDDAHIRPFRRGFSNGAGGGSRVFWLATGISCGAPKRRQAVLAQTARNPVSGRRDRAAASRISWSEWAPLRAPLNRIESGSGYRLRLSSSTAVFGATKASSHVRSGLQQIYA